MAYNEEYDDEDAVGGEPRRSRKVTRKVKESLGVEPTPKLTIIRGVSGSGKTTRRINIF